MSGESDYWLHIQSQWSMVHDLMAASPSESEAQDELQDLVPRNIWAWMWEALSGSFLTISLLSFVTWSIKASLGAQLVMNLPTMQETRVQCLAQEDPLEEEMAPHSSILAGESHEQRSLVGYSPWGRRVRHDLATNHYMIYQGFSP